MDGMKKYFNLISIWGPHIKIQINKNTLEATVDEPCVINYIREDENMIELEISTQDPEVNYPYISTTP